LLVWQAASVPPAKVAASVRRIFGAGATASSLVVNADTVFRIARGDSVLGFALVRAVKGKDQPITFLVATDTADRLRDIDILVYREPYGGEVAYDAWRRQFRGKSVDDQLEVGRDIRSISGATISVNAVTLGVRRALGDLTAWHRTGVIK
jgi:Na+-translocating ferredoxin:NAD+ oxidoreductase RnfG subunit